MKVALGFKAHSGWAALVAVGRSDGAFRVIDRRRIELADDDVAPRARQPYHAAVGLPTSTATDVVARGVESARCCAIREIRAAQNRSLESGHEIVACAVLVPAPMPDWSIDEILAVHIRMHKAEGVLFPNALVQAAAACGLNVVAIPERRLMEHAATSFASSLSRLLREVEMLGKSVGAPWGKDQKSSALAAMIGLQP
jgi:hypothetical protein